MDEASKPDRALEEAATSVRRPLFWVWVALVLMLLSALVFPIRSNLIRGLILTFGLLIWAGLPVLVWRKRWLRIALTSAPIGLLLVLAAPGRKTDTQSLRAAYIRSVRGYEGVPYVWGGETGRGIDCSGLVRRGMMDAALSEGIRTLNPALVRESIALWIRDSSARELGRGDGGRLEFVADANGINETDAGRLLPGDVAVTRDGIHTLIYCGGDSWTEADPALGKVVSVRAPAANNRWFRVPIRLLRWKRLSG